MRKPRAITNCVASHYTGPSERIVEFSFPGTDGPAGGRLRLSYVNGEPRVELYRVEGCKVVAPDTDMATRLRDIERTLADHPDASKGNTKVHYALMRAKVAP